MKFVTKTYEIHSDKITNGKQLSIILLSDLHLAEYGEDNIELINEIRRVHPDLILSSGDLITAMTDHDTLVAEKLLETLAKDYPVYYAAGNHEERLKVRTEWFGNRYQTFLKKMKQYGVQFLHNESQTINVKDLSICIHGLALPLNYFKRMARIKLEVQTIETLLGKAEEDKFNILLAHHPRFGTAYFSWGADLILSGHVHGGVMRIGSIACISPDMRIFPKYGYGKFNKDNRTMIVSSGLGEHTIPFRIFNPKELTHIVIK